MKQKHQEKEQYISMLAQDKEEMKVLDSNRFSFEDDHRFSPLHFHTMFVTIHFFGLSSPSLFFSLSFRQSWQSYRIW